MRKLVFMLLALAVLPASAQVYKWTDAQGKVHYGDQPPAGAKQEVVKTTVASVSSQSTAKQESLAEREGDFRERAIKQRQADEEQARVQAKRCEQARSRLIPESVRGVYRTNKKGEREYIDDAERNKLQAAAKRDVAQYCGG